LTIFKKLKPSRGRKRNGKLISDGKCVKKRTEKMKWKRYKTGAEEIWLSIESTITKKKCQQPTEQKINTSGLKRTNNAGSQASN
jgi:hypothetical protein